MLRPMLRSTIFLSVCLAMIGCTKPGPSDRPRAVVYKARGVVKFFGSPVSGAMVSFSPTGNQPAAIGKTNDMGEFVLTTYRAGDGAAAGDYEVAVLLIDSGEPAPPSDAHPKSHDAPGAIPSQSHNAPKTSKPLSILPSKYGDPKRSGLKAKVDPSSQNVFPFDIDKP